nr:unnamed protein product [Callosobruchus analis]CAI5865701.1 unnamed protein product [Callosobruchus analis]
MSAAMS